MEYEIGSDSANRAYRVWLDITEADFQKRLGNAVIREAVSTMSQKLVDEFVKTYGDDLLRVVNPEILIPAIEAKFKEVLINKRKDYNE